MSISIVELVEFKLASNSKLKQNLAKQVDIYKAASNTVLSICTHVVPATPGICTFRGRIEFQKLKPVTTHAETRESHFCVYFLPWYTWTVVMIDAYIRNVQCGKYVTLYSQRQNYAAAWVPYSFPMRIRSSSERYRRDVNPVLRSESSCLRISS